MEAEIITTIFIILFLNIFCNQDKTPETESTIKEYKKCNNIGSGPNEYELNYECIKANNLTFPMKSVVSGKIIRNREKNYSFKKGTEFEIDSKFINSFRLMVSDTTNFSWGELTTTYTDYIIEFYDSKGRMINQAKISYDGMLWTLPILKTTKFGLLTSKGEAELKTLMNTYSEKNK